MSADATLTPAQLFSITKKKRPHAQHKWFKNNFGVDLPCNSESVIITQRTLELLEARRAGLMIEAQKPDRPNIYRLRPA